MLSAISFLLVLYIGVLFFALIALITHFSIYETFLFTIMVSVNIKKTSTKYYTATSLDVGSHKKTQKGVPGLIVTTFFYK